MSQTNINPSMALVISLSSLQSNLQKKVDNSLFLHGISFTEFMVMLHLNQASQKTLRRIELAELLGLSASGVTRLLAPMEKIKLVQKESNARDARVSLVKLSPAGNEILTDAMTTFKQSTASITQDLDKAQINQFLQLSNILQ